MSAPKINLSDSVIEKLSPEDRKAFGVKTRSEINTQLEQKGEKEIQQTVENMLRQRGYWPRSPAFLDGRVPERGWYIHIHQTKKNPIVLDLIIMSNSGRYLELELKTATGPVRPEQEAILKSPGRVLARSVDEAIREISKWEAKEKV